MPSSKVLSATILGLESHVVEVEADTHSGLHAFSIVGLPDTAVKESKDRVDAAIKNTGLKPPHQCGRITINLAPADVRKEGPLYDLPIALGILIATKQLGAMTEKKLFVGELSLDGKIRPIRGALPIAIMAKKLGFDELYLPIHNAPEASVVKDLKIIPLQELKSLILHLNGEKKIEYFERKDDEEKEIQTFSLDMSFVKGQEYAKRALEIAAAGGHNVLML